MGLILTPETGLQVQRVKPITSGLVAYWPFNEKGGDNVRDIAGGNTGTINGATWVGSERGAALSFDGNDHVKTASRMAAITPASDYTVVIRTVIDDFTSGSRFIASQVRSSSDRFTLHASGSGEGVKSRFGHYNGSSYNATDDIVLPGGGLTLFIAAVNFADTSKRYHINDQVVFDAGLGGANPGSSGQDGLFLGSNASGSDLFIVGVYSLLAVYNRALSDAEVRELYRSTAVLYEPSRKQWLGAAAGGVSNISGSFDITFTTAGVLEGTGALAGSFPITFSESGVLGGTGALAGDFDITFTESGVLTGAGALAGSFPITFTFGGALVSPGAMSGAMSITLTPTGTLVGTGALAGSSSVTLTFNGNLTQLFHLISGSMSVSISMAGQMRACRSLTSCAPDDSSYSISGGTALDKSCGSRLTDCNNDFQYLAE